ncbi:hypothetical protein [Algoriphagus confluentis]|uniref:TetR/AcrR family transcriptional regulator n=1 Tax=Algoriphagus confluentis TaxID=1697556 RepID=A0ABQ6PUJ6_9BACT|nr:hypothetical protein Aconfl_43000 [Algoriphagus confluentis]
MTVEKKTKGKKTRENILYESRKILNETGVFLTLRELSKIIGITIGGITNYFPTKDHLFMGLGEILEKDVAEVSMGITLAKDPSFFTFVDLLSKIMDIQFENRSTIRFISLASQSQKTLFDQITESWNSQKDTPVAMVQALVDEQLLSESILEEFQVLVFRFQFINTMTTWISSYSLYDNDQSFDKVKPIYIAGILNVFEPYLTPKGKEEYHLVFKQLKTNYENKTSAGD